jgi:hypothetical protein
MVNPKPMAAASKSIKKTHLAPSTLRSSLEDWNNPNPVPRPLDDPLLLWGLVLLESSTEEELSRLFSDDTESSDEASSQISLLLSVSFPLLPEGVVVVPPIILINECDFLLFGILSISFGRPRRIIVRIIVCFSS